MSRRATGSSYFSRGHWYAAISLGGKDKAHFQMSWAKTHDEADARRIVLAEIASDLRNADLAHMIRPMCKQAAEVDAATLLDIVKLSKGLVAGTEHPNLSVVPRGAPSQAVSAATDVWTVRRLGEHWTSHRLADESGGEIRRIDQEENERKLRKHVYPVVLEERTIGDLPVREFTLAHAKHIIRQPTLLRGSKPHVGQCLKYIFGVAATVLEIIPESPLRNWRLPAGNDEQEGAFVFPKEDLALMTCRDVPLVRRIFFGAAAREGIRRGRLVTLPWDRLHLTEHGHKGVALVPGKPNKKGVNWVLQDGTAEALRRWRRICPSRTWVFPTEALPRYRRRRRGQPMDVDHFAHDLRDALKTAGVTRRELFESEGGFRRLVGHDLRATYVTLARANGESDNVIRRRTRHTTTDMIDRYDHAIGVYAELECGTLLPLHEAIPELAEMEPSDEWKNACLGAASEGSIVGESSAGSSPSKKRS